MKCERCGKRIEKAFWAEEGDWLGKKLCRTCRAEVEEISREKYRKGLTKQHTNQYRLDVYRIKSEDLD